MLIRCNFKELKADPVERAIKKEFMESVYEFESEEYSGFQQQGIKELTPKKEALLELLDLAYSDICKRLASIKVQLAKSEITSGAFTALELFLKEFVKNAIDCDATFFAIKIIKEGNNIKIQIYDDGKPFDDHYLKGQKTVDYFSSHASGYDWERENRYGIQSDKDKRSSLGGCGEGLANCANFLFKNSGVLLIGRSPKIELLSPKNVRERKKMHGFDEITNNQSWFNNIFNPKEQKMKITIQPQTPVLLNEQDFLKKLKEKREKKSLSLFTIKSDASTLSAISLSPPVPMEIKSPNVESSAGRKRKSLTQLKLVTSKKRDISEPSSRSPGFMEIEPYTPYVLREVKSENLKPADPYNIGFFSFASISSIQKKQAAESSREKRTKRHVKKIPQPFPNFRKRRSAVTEG